MTDTARIATLEEARAFTEKVKEGPRVWSTPASLGTKASVLEPIGDKGYRALDDLRVWTKEGRSPHSLAFENMAHAFNYDAVHAEDEKNNRCGNEELMFRKGDFLKPNPWGVSLLQVAYIGGHLDKLAEALAVYAKETFTPEEIAAHGLTGHYDHARWEKVAREARSFQERIGKESLRRKQDGLEPVGESMSGARLWTSDISKDSPGPRER